MYAERLKKIRKELDLKADDMAGYLGIKSRTYGSYEREENMLPIEIGTRICNIFNVNGNWLLTGIGEMFIKKSATIGSRIADIQDNNNLSSYKFAEMLDIPESELIDIINDKKEPDMRVLKNLKKHFGVSIDYILYGE